MSVDLEVDNVVPRDTLCPSTENLTPPNIFLLPASAVRSRTPVSLVVFKPSAFRYFTAVLEDVYSPAAISSNGAGDPKKSRVPGRAEAP